jgi:hypothetical protein
MFFLPRHVESAITGPEEAKNLAGRKALRLIQIRLTPSTLGKIASTRQDNSSQARIADSSSINAVNFSLARAPPHFDIVGSFTDCSGPHAAQICSLQAVRSPSVSQQ